MKQMHLSTLSSERTLGFFIFTQYSIVYFGKYVKGLLTFGWKKTSTLISNHVAVHNIWKYSSIYSFKWNIIMEQFYFFSQRQNIIQDYKIGMI